LKFSIKFFPKTTIYTIKLKVGHQIFKKFINYIKDKLFNQKDKLFIQHFPDIIMHIILNFGNNNARIHSRVLVYFPKEFPEGFYETCGMADSILQFHQGLN